MNEDFEFSSQFNKGSMTKWGASDFYNDKLEEIIAAIASGLPFDTDWGGCEKELLTLRIICTGQSFVCGVSVTDDFDTHGTTELLARRGETDEETLINIQNTLDNAADLAREDQKNNREYRGFLIRNEQGAWAETYIQDEAGWSEHPPGSNYNEWGFQGGCDSIPEHVKEKMEEWVRSSPPTGTSFKLEGWQIYPWDD